MTTKNDNNISPIKQSKCVLNSQLSNEEIVEALDNIDLAIKAEENNLIRFEDHNIEANNVKTISSTLEPKTSSNKEQLASKIINEYKSNFETNSKQTSDKAIDIRHIVDKDFFRDFKLYSEKNKEDLNIAKEEFNSKGADDLDNKSLYSLMAIGQEHLNATQDQLALISVEILANAIKKEYSFDLQSNGFIYKAIVYYEDTNKQDVKFKTTREYNVTIKDKDISHISLIDYNCEFE
jgi:hypothetical protein